MIWDDLSDKLSNKEKVSFFIHLITSSVKLANWAYNISDNVQPLIKLITITEMVYHQSTIYDYEVALAGGAVAAVSGNFNAKIGNNYYVPFYKRSENEPFINEAKVGEFAPFLQLVKESDFRGTKLFGKKLFEEFYFRIT